MIWEPWKPEPGQRVRIRLSAECDVQFWGPLALRGHPSEFEALTGTVLQPTPYPSLAPWLNTHPYFVELDTPITVQLGDGYFPAPAEGNYFAAVELEPLA